MNISNRKDLTCGQLSWSKVSKICLATPNFFKNLWHNQVNSVLKWSLGNSHFVGNLKTKPEIQQMLSENILPWCSFVSLHKTYFFHWTRGIFMTCGCFNSHSESHPIDKWRVNNKTNTQKENFPKAQQIIEFLPQEDKKVKLMLEVLQ